MGTLPLGFYHVVPNLTTELCFPLWVPFGVWVLKLSSGASRPHRHRGSSRPARSVGRFGGAGGRGRVPAAGGRGVGAGPRSSYSARGAHVDFPAFLSGEGCEYGGSSLGDSESCSTTYHSDLTEPLGVHQSAGCQGCRPGLGVRLPARLVTQSPAAFAPATEAVNWCCSRSQGPLYRTQVTWDVLYLQWQGHPVRSYRLQKVRESGDRCQVEGLSGRLETPSPRMAFPLNIY